MSVPSSGPIKAPSLLPQLQGPTAPVLPHNQRLTPDLYGSKYKTEEWGELLYCRRILSSYSVGLRMDVFKDKAFILMVPSTMAKAVYDFFEQNSTK